MVNTELMPDEKIISKRKPSILSQRHLWLGVILILLAFIVFIIGQFGGFTVLNTPFSALLSFLGINLSIFSALPALPSILDILGFVEIIVAELSVYFRDYIITNYRILDQHGIISKDVDVILASKISNISLKRTIFDRIFGLGRIIIEPEESASPKIVLYGVKDPYSFQNDILKLINKT